MVSRIKNLTFVVSLLQPPPETFANFDELILLSEGKIIYSGPVDEVIEHFSSLGYEIPERMDVADWLQVCHAKAVRCASLLDFAADYYYSPFRRCRQKTDGSISSSPAKISAKKNL